MPAQLIAIQAGTLLLDSAGLLPSLQYAAQLHQPGTQQFHIGNHLAIQAKTSAPPPPGHIWVDIRSSVTTLGRQVWMQVAKGVELLNWAQQTRFCSCCGKPVKRASEISLRCTGCGREMWPQLSPCVMVLVRRDDRALLVHARNFSRPFFGLVAGFVETGETLEECVRREVAEETGLQITDIRYTQSQSWPFPAQLMMGFTARYAGGELRFPDGELSDGNFFSADDLPMLPPPPSLARTLIEQWLDEVRREGNS